jgi:cytochrome d ubiquinol oxidase subunit I
VLGLIATRSLDRDLPGITELVEIAAGRIANGINAYVALQDIRADPQDPEPRERFAEYQRDLGYALLLKRYREDIENATGEEIAQAALDTVPDVWPLFWSFRVMVFTGFFYIAFFALWFGKASQHRLHTNRTLLWAAVVTMPMPWIAIQLGWIIAEYGRQPWVVEGVLPTFYAASGLNWWDLAISLTFFVVLYTILAIIMAWLMVRVIKAGPSDKLELMLGGDEAIEPETQTETASAKDRPSGNPEALA